MNSQGKSLACVKSSVDKNIKHKLTFDIISVTFYKELITLYTFIKAFVKCNINYKCIIHNNIHNNIHDINPCIDSHLDNQDILTIQNKYTKKYHDDIINKHYEWTLRDELNDRLILLINKFGLEFIHNLGIEIITINDFEKKTLKDAIIYYCNIVCKLKKYMYHIIKLYDKYIRTLL